MGNSITLQIKTRTSFNDIERLYRDLENHDTSVNLKLPVKLAYGGIFGIESALIQFIGSWARSSSSPLLSSYPSSLGDSVFEKMLESPHGLIATYMSNGILGSNGKRIDRENLLLHAKERVDSMQAGNLNSTLKGPGVFLACFAGANREFLRPLYQRPNTDGIRGGSDFLHLTKDILNSCTHKLKASVSEYQLENISVLIHELFENTNDHATQDKNNRNYTWAYPNVRGLLVRKTAIHTGQRMDMFKDLTSVVAFSKRFLQSNTKSLSMVEITVFDFGPGIAEKDLSNQTPSRELAKVPLEEERLIVKKAFTLGHSTKKGSGVGVGVGLDSVVKSLGKLNAFIRLRTGRLCLSQDFSTHNRDIDLVDYFPQQSELSCTAGTTFSILIPLI